MISAQAAAGGTTVSLYVRDRLAIPFSQKACRSAKRDVPRGPAAFFVCCATLRVYRAGVQPLMEDRLHCRAAVWAESMPSYCHPSTARSFRI
jgi:hypothetical protein